MYVTNKSNIKNNTGKVDLGYCHGSVTAVFWDHSIRPCYHPVMFCVWCSWFGPAVPWFPLIGTDSKSNIFIAPTSPQDFPLTPESLGTSLFCWAPLFHHTASLSFHGVHLFLVTIVGTKKIIVGGWWTPPYRSFFYSSQILYSHEALILGYPGWVLPVVKRIHNSIYWPDNSTLCVVCLVPDIVQD